jgi:outer membrane protein assembly factor BamB
VIGGHIVLQAGFAEPIHAVDAATGKAVATMPPEGWANAAIGHDGLVFFHGRGGLVARDLKSGDVRWRVMMSVAQTQPVVVSKGHVFAQQRETDEASPWVGFEAANGRRSFELHTDPYAPLAANDDVLVSFENDELVGYSASDGKERWRSALDVQPPIMIENGRLFARVEDQLGIFAAGSGSLHKRIDLGGTDAFHPSAIRPQLAASGNLVAWIQDEVVHVADAGSGKESWRQERAQLLAITPSVLVTSWDDELRGLDPATGSSKWKLTLDGDPLSITAREDTIAVRLSGSRYAVVDGKSGKRRFGYDLPPL